jgi:phytoene/squalene synthetase
MTIFDKVSFKTSKLVTKSYSTSFSLAVGMLEKKTSEAIYSIYGFVRFADEIVDTFHDKNKTLLLDNFERDLKDAIEQEISLNPVLHSFVITIKKYSIDYHLIDSFLASMRADLTKQLYENQPELNAYIYGSADVVGLMCLKVFLNGDEKSYNELKAPAERLGSAFQKVNFLRDLKADTEGLQRIYFPELKSGKFDDEIKKVIVRNIENDFTEAKKGIDCLPGKSKLAVYLAYSYYKKLLKILKQTPASEIANARLRLPGYYKIYLLLKAYLKYKFNLI